MRCNLACHGSTMMESDEMLSHTSAITAGEATARQPTGRLIPASELSKDFGFHRRTLARHMADDPEFPKPVRMAQRLYWFEAEIAAYKNLLIQRALSHVPEPKSPQLSARTSKATPRKTP
jgi:predicted DNA-binding transcriptional regulator AlpA